MITTAEEIEREIAVTVPIGAVESGLSYYPFLDLTDEDFERLVYSLFKASSPDGHAKNWDATALMVRGADAGRDILLTTGGAPRSVVQCKRLESALSLPAVFREVAKLILFAKVNGDLSFNDSLDYFMAVARDPAGTVVDFFARRDELALSRTDDLKAAAREVRESYKTLAHLSVQKAEDSVLAAFPSLQLHLLRPGDFNSWLSRERRVAGTFFKQRVVVDNTFAETKFDELKAMLGALGPKLDGVAALTDEDLKIIQDRIAGTPASHRLNLGVATLFGFPPEMFAEDGDLQARLDRIAALRQAVDQDYIDWVFGRSRAIALDICTRPELMATTQKFARQIPGAFLGMVAKQCCERALGSDVMERIIRDVTGEPHLKDDDARLEHVCQVLLRSGERYLAGDFSELVGDEDLVAFKLELIADMMAEIPDRAALVIALDLGKAIFRPILVEAADRMRDLYCHRTSILLSGGSGLDDTNALKRMADAVKILTELKPKVG